MFAFDYERSPPSTRRSVQAIVDHLAAVWRQVGHIAYINGAFLGESGFLRCITDHSRKRPYVAAHEAAGAAATFKRTMMIELSRRYRMPAGVSIDHDGYWSKARRW